MSASTTDTVSGSADSPVYNSSCHCGFVTYSARLNFTKPNPQTGAIITKCNCSICLKGGSALVMPKEGSFKLQVLETRLRLFGEKDITSTIAMHNLGSVLGRLEKYDETIEWLDRCLNARTEVLGPDAPQILSAAKKLKYLRDEVSDRLFEGDGPQICNDETQDISSSSSACSENPVFVAGENISDIS